MLSEYIVSVIKIVAFGAVLLSISHTKMKKSTSLVMGIVIVSAIMLPLVDIMGDKGMDFPTFDDYENPEIRDESIEVAFERGLREYISSTLDVEPSSVDVFVDEFEFSTMRAGRIYVTLSGKAIYADYRELESRIEKEFTNNGECEVKIIVG